MIPTHSLPGLLAVAALTAQAQTTAPPRAADPLDAQARVPALTYQSALKPDRRGADDKLISWREANDNVARIGGWRVYAREAQSPEPAAMPKPAMAPSAAPAAPPPPPALQRGHDGHKKP